MAKAIDKELIDRKTNDLHHEIDDIAQKVKSFDIDDIKRRLRSLYKDARIRGAETYYDAKDKLDDWQDQLSDEVRKKPVQSVAIAVGIGFVLGLIIKR